LSVNVMATLREPVVDALAFHPDPELTQRIEDALTLQRWARKVAIKAQQRRWVEQAEQHYTQPELVAIRHDLDRRIAAMGSK
jgi:hypothetical protein